MKLVTLGLLASAGALAATPAFADRPPNNTERASVEGVLKANGFISWEEIELDDDGPVWEIDDARTSNRQAGKFDLKIDPRTMKILKRQRDD